jgi:AcrR family transcriptional regulator
MVDQPPGSSARRDELLELSYGYALEHGLTGLSLRPLAAAVGSSPRVLLYLFGSRDALVRALLARARADELDLLARLREEGADDLVAAALEMWRWVSIPEHRGLVTLWLEGYARSLVEHEGPWAGFGRATVVDWLDLLSSAQSATERESPAVSTRSTLALALLRGGLIDLLATGDLERTTSAVEQGLRAL